MIQEGVEVKKPFALVATTALLAGLVLLGLSDTAVSVDDAIHPDGEATGAVGKASDSSATATIAIRMYAVAGE